MLNKKVSVGILVAMAAFAVSASAFAEEGGRDDNRGPKMGQKMQEVKDRVRMASSTRPLMAAIRPLIVGKVLTISGNTLTIASRLPKTASSTSATTTLTVDATNAIIIKGNATSTIGSISIGDNIVVQGTLTGTNIVATKIFDGKIENLKRNDKDDGDNDDDKRDKKKDKVRDDKAKFVGNGQPVVAGTVSSVGSTTLVITNGSSTSYTVDAANAKIIVKGNESSTLSGIKVGDRVIVQGVVSGTSITASSIIDGSVKKNGEREDKPKGFFSNAGGFFKRLFGF